MPKRHIYRSVSSIQGLIVTACRFFCTSFLPLSASLRLLRFALLRFELRLPSLPSLRSFRIAVGTGTGTGTRTGPGTGTRTGPGTGTGTGFPKFETASENELIQDFSYI